MHLLPRLLRDLGSSRRLLGGVLVCTLVYAGARVVSPLLVRQLLDATLRGRPAHLLGAAVAPADAVVVVPALILAVALLLAGAQYLLRFWGGLLGQRLAADLQVRLFEHLLRLPGDALERRGLGRQSVRFGSDMHALRRFVSRALPEFVRDGLAVVGIGVTLAVLHRPLALPILVALAVFLATLLLSWNRLQSANRTLRTERSRAAGIALDRLRIASAVKLARAERREAVRLRHAQHRVVDAGARAAHLAGLLSGGAEIVVGAAVAVALGLGARQALAGQISAGEMVAFYGLALLLVSPLRSLSRAMESLAPGTVALDRLYRVLDRPRERERTGDRPLQISRGEIVLEGVQTAQGIIPDVTIPPGLTVLQGEAARWIGPILVGLEVPIAGRVLVDGADLAGTALQSLRRAVAYIPDPPVLLKGSLRRNLRGAERSLTDEAMLEALRAVGATWASSLDLKVGSAGRRLSPAERWHVLCAHALLARARVVIIDSAPIEPEHLDAASRALRAAGARTVVLVGSAARTGSLRAEMGGLHA